MVTVAERQIELITFPQIRCFYKYLSYLSF